MNHMVQFTVPMTFWVTRSSQKKNSKPSILSWMSKMWSFLSILFKQEEKNKKQVESGKLTIEYSPFVQLIKNQILVFYWCL